MMVTQSPVRGVETLKISEGNVEGPKSTTQAIRGVPTSISKRMIEHHERTDEVEDLLGALRFSCWPFGF